MNRAGHWMIIARYSAILIAASVWMVGELWAVQAKANPEAGRKIYLESWQNCHGPAGKGDSDMAAYLTPPPANLTAKATQSKTDAQIA